MTEIIQCENCGAVLAPEDIFCGECGAPHPASGGAVEPVKPDQPAVPPVAPGPPPVAPAALPSARPTAPAQKGWRAAFITLVVLGAITCVVGLAAFLIFGSTPGENMTPQEDWLYSAVCCLLPIGGIGALLMAIGAVIWYTRVRKP
jgi:hypothetical protein